MTTPLQLAAAAGAALLAGGINAVAGGGTLVTFPVLVGLGTPALHANVTSTLSLAPGHFGGTYAQRSLVARHRSRATRALPAAALGGLLGSALLVLTSDSLFEAVVPWLILAACVLLALQDRIRAVVTERRSGSRREAPPMLVIGVFASSIYGGYFGAGLGIMLLAILGLTLDDDLRSLNAFKTMLAGTINLVAAAFLAFSGSVEWQFVAVMAPASLLGGHLGGLVSTRLRPAVLRAVVVCFGAAVAIGMLVG